MLEAAPVVPVGICIYLKRLRHFTGAYRLITVPQTQIQNANPFSAEKGSCHVRAIWGIQGYRFGDIFRVVLNMFQGFGNMDLISSLDRIGTGAWDTIVSSIDWDTWNRLPVQVFYSAIGRIHPQSWENNGRNRPHLIFPIYHATSKQSQIAFGIWIANE